jgi:hypothetical protein
MRIFELNISVYLWDICVYLRSKEESTDERGLDADVRRFLTEYLCVSAGPLRVSAVVKEESADERELNE